jgi:hypothetical protein
MLLCERWMQALGAALAVPCRRRFQGLTDDQSAILGIDKINFVSDLQCANSVDDC